MEPTRRLQCYSADLRLWLAVGDRNIELAAAGPETVRPRRPCDLACGTQAELFLTIDGRKYRWEVVLDEGAVPFEKEIRVRTVKYPQRTSLFSPIELEMARMTGVIPE